MQECCRQVEVEVTSISRNNFTKLGNERPFSEALYSVYMQYAYLILQSGLPESDFVGYEPVAVLAVEVLDAREVLVHRRPVVPAVQKILSVAEIANKLFSAYFILIKILNLITFLYFNLIIKD